ncbi:hypothetical protein KWI07_17760 [Enterobacter bugandensis]|uniref:hypothetical protein n=1 Tax=Enterobacter bugandensis TaxID=881260 RepID=UPI0021D2B8BE|nr:hypothetical protein [Enterobacter bugandensis]MCU6162274.1 hypothetical protein [Enterobacter bugandensis]
MKKTFFRILEVLSLMSWFTLLAFATHTLRHFVGLLVTGDRAVSIPHIMVVVIACLIIIIGSTLYLVRLAVRQMKAKE